MRKKVLLMAMVLLTAAILAGCGEQAKVGFSAENEIGVLSREDGSGTRGAFVELLGIEQKNAAGEKVDYTTNQAVITNSTAVMLTTVSGDLYAVGYISLGSLNDTVKAVNIDGAEPTLENVKNGSYKVARPFNIATKGDLSPAAQDFISFIMSAEGQQVVAENGYIPVAGGAPTFSGSRPQGKLVIAGSSSVTPVMEKLKEAYQAYNPDLNVEVQQSDSSTGMADTIDGSCDIGMASRDLKESELAQGLQAQTIAMDGIVVIVNPENPVANLSAEQVKDIFMGNLTSWSEVQ